MEVTRVVKGDDPPMPKLVFVGGSGRSGTTLMHKILCSSPNVAGGAEFDHLYHFMLHRRRMRSTKGLARQACYYDPARLDAAWRQFVLELLGNVLATKPHAGWIAEKTPSNVAVIEDLLGLFPQARFVAMVRDGRDVAASHLRIQTRLKVQNPSIARRWLREFDVKEVARVWKMNIDQIDSAVADADVGSRVIVVRFENLVEHPETEIRRVCEFVGLQFDPAMLMPEQLDAKLTGHDANIDGVWYDEKQFAQRISNASVGKWTSMSAWNRAVASVLMDPYLVRLGYAEKERSLTSLIRGISSVRRRMR